MWKKGEKTDNSNGEWYVDWFDETYFQLYSHRNIEEAQHQVNWIADHFAGDAAGGVADLACGAGRHSWAMAENYGWRVVGIDLSVPLLHKAKDGGTGPENGREYVPPAFIRADIRALPLLEASFGLAVNLFTSFGYFQSDEEHESALSQVADILRTDGILVLDLFNPRTLINNLVAADEVEREGMRIVQHRRIAQDERRIVKEIEIHPKEGPARKIVESVRYFEPEELDRMLSSAGFEVMSRFGDFSEEAFEPEMSPRMITCARKTT